MVLTNLFINSFMCGMNLKDQWLHSDFYKDKIVMAFQITILSLTIILPNFLATISFCIHEPYALCFALVHEFMNPFSNHIVEWQLGFSDLMDSTTSNPPCKTS